MTDREMVFRQRKRIFEEWRWKRLTWQEVKEKYGFSKKWFYKWRKRYHTYGDEGLWDKPKKSPPAHRGIGWDAKLAIMDYVYDNPTHGPDRIARELPFKISGKAVWSYLTKEDLNTRRKRRLWAHHQGKPVLTKKEESSINARYNHIKSSYPGELVSIDTFCVSVKNWGRLWQYTACDTYSSYGWARLYLAKNHDSTVDFLEYILERVPEGKIKRILTDRGTEFYSARRRRHLECIEKLLGKHGIRHTLTKVAHPWTNGYAERLNQTVWQEFYLCRLTKVFQHLGQLRRELEAFMLHYNFKRRHTGYKLIEGGYEFPACAFYDIRERERCVEIRY
jgi:transposase InsO family protein